jgi:hypothetical protein
VVSADVVKDADHGAPHAITESLGAVYVDNASDIILLAVSDGVMSREVLADRHKPEQLRLRTPPQ